MELFLKKSSGGSYLLFVNFHWLLSKRKYLYLRKIVLFIDLPYVLNYIAFWFPGTLISDTRDGDFLLINIETK